MLQLACHNPEINWRTEEVQITRYPDECGKKWKTRQIKQEWKNRKRKREKKEAEREEGRIQIEEEMEIARMIEEKEKEEKTLIEIRTVEEIVPKKVL